MCRKWASIVGAHFDIRGLQMAFKKLEVRMYPRRQWSLLGAPGAGKSTFAAQMAAPLLVVDADHRFTEVAKLVLGEVLEISDNPAHHVDPEKIVKLLEESMPTTKIGTVVIDSLTSIISPIVVQTLFDIEAGRNKNRVSGFKDKALAMRLIQDGITGWGTDTLWIYHTRQGRDQNAVEVETTSIPAVELARLRRSLNVSLRIVQDGNGRGVHVDWSRRGRSGFTLWDGSGTWAGMPRKLEQAIYDDLTADQMDAIAKSIPIGFASVADAIGWGYEQGCFNDAVHAKNAYEELKRLKDPGSAPEMWALWIAEVGRRVDEKAPILA